MILKVGRGPPYAGSTAYPIEDLRLAISEGSVAVVIFPEARFVSVSIDSHFRP